MGTKRRVHATAAPPARGFPSHSESNPFATTWGRRTANAAARSASTRAAASSRNSFADRRIGEDDPHATEEDKYLARLQRARSSRASKRARFTLDDALDNAAAAGGHDPLHMLTHGGAAIQSEARLEGASGKDMARNRGLSLLKDDYTEQGLDDDEDDEDRFNEGLAADGVRSEDGSDSDGFARRDGPGSRAANDALFMRRPDGDNETGAEDGPGRTHQEVMDEVVARSKMHKADRQREKAEVDDQTSELDSQLHDILRMLGTSARSRLSKETAPNSGTALFGANNEDQTKRAPDVVAREDMSAYGKSPANDRFNYEQVYVELASEKRSRPTDRTKTQEEKDVEERERLEKLEELRTSRMKYVDYDSEDNKGDGANSRKKRRRSKEAPQTQKRHITGDDLEDDFAIDSFSSEAEEDGYSGLESGSEEPSSAVSGDADEDADMEGTTSEAPSEQHIGEGIRRMHNPSFNSETNCSTLANGHSSDKKNHDDRMEESSKLDHASTCSWDVPAITQIVSDSDLPFVYAKCPTSLEELMALFKDLTVSQRGVVVGRLRTCFAKSLNPSVNGALLCDLLRVLLLTINLASATASIEKIELAYAEAMELLPHVYALSPGSPREVTTWARNRLEDVFTSISEKSNHGLAQCISPGDLVVLKCISLLFPGSDLRHGIISPLTIALSHAVGSVPLRSAQDLSCACFCSTILLSLLAPARRVSGDVISFLVGALKSFEMCPIAKERVIEAASKGCGTLPGDGDARLALSDCFSASSRERKKPVCTRQQTCVHVKLRNAIMGLIKACTYNGELESIRICMDPVVSALRACGFAEGALIAESIAASADAEEKGRKPLRAYLEKRGVSGMKLLNPKFNSENGIYSGKQKGSGGIAFSDLESQRRLRQQVKKEARSAAREVRRGAEALNSVRQRDFDDHDAYRSAKTAQARAFLEKQQHVAKLQSKKVATGTEGLAAAGRKRKKW